MRMVGVGEEMPHELEDLLPRYSSWPQGVTIGPATRPPNASESSRPGNLETAWKQIAEAGWAPESVIDRYRALVEADNRESLQRATERDLKDNVITSEVVALLTPYF